jgi:3-oxoacyl-[acyl-carrier-protein] synthase II
VRLVTHALHTDAAALAAARPDWHRGVRRFPVPVQLALAALDDVRGHLAEPARATLIALAPTRAGSPEVHGWVRAIFERARAGQPAPRMNPTHTLHVVDNLALSAASIALGNREEGLGVGGAPGQVWQVRALAAEAFARGAREVVILGGDQLRADRPGPAAGAAVVLAADRPGPAPRRRRVVITGLGAWSALGAGVAALWDGLLAGRSGIAVVPELARMGGKVTTGGAVAGAAGERRDLALAGATIDDALAQARLPAAATALVWGTGLDTYAAGADGPTHVSAGACFAALAARHRAPCRMLAVACATGTHAVGEALRLVRSGAVDACVAGGSSVMLTPYYVTGFAALGAVAPDRPGEDPATACRPFDQARRGFALADGAGALVVEELEHARARGATPLAELVGFGASQDAFDLNRPPEDGAGARLCIERALADAGLAAEAIDAVNAHGTGTIAGDVAEAAALRAALGARWRQVPVSSVKGAIGHAMAAAGALEAIVAAQSAHSGLVPPTVHLATPDPRCALDHVIGAPRDAGARVVLSTSFGMGGQNAALLLRRVPGAS